MFGCVLACNPIPEETDNEQVTIVDLKKLVERKLMNSEEEGPCTSANAYNVLSMKNEGLFSESI